MLKLFYILLLGTIAPSLHGESGNPFVSGFYFMKKEIWLPIQGATGYEISTNFLVRSWNKGNPKGNFILDKPKILTPTIGSHGYLSVHIKYDGEIGQNELLHRLIAKHFITNFYGYKNINHINGDKLDNRIENLEWCNQSMNGQHAIRIGLHKIENDKTELELRNYEINGLKYKVAPNGRVFINGREKHPMATKGGGLGIYFDRKNQIDVHRLVALLYIPNPENKKYVLHINGIRNDNRVENLRWATRQEIVIHATVGLCNNSNKRILGGSGKFNPSAQCINQIDRNTGIIIKVWDTIKAAADSLGISRSAITKAATGKNPTAAGYKWGYTNKNT